MLVSSLLSLKSTDFACCPSFLHFRISFMNALPLISGRGFKFCARARTVLHLGPLTFKMLPAPMSSKCIVNCYSAVDVCHDQTCNNYWMTARAYRPPSLGVYKPLMTVMKKMISYYKFPLLGISSYIIPFHVHNNVPLRPYKITSSPPVPILVQAASTIARAQ
jgi:hypothetical protein